MSKAKIAWRITSTAKSADKNGFVLSRVEYLDPPHVDSIDVKFIKSHGSCQNGADIHYIREYVTRDGSPILVATGTSV